MKATFKTRMISFALLGTIAIAPLAGCGKGNNDAGQPAPVPTTPLPPPPPTTPPVPVGPGGCGAIAGTPFTGNPYAAFLTPQFNSYPGTTTFSLSLGTTGGYSPTPGYGYGIPQAITGTGQLIISQSDLDPYWGGQYGYPGYPSQGTSYTICVTSGGYPDTIDNYSGSIRMVLSGTVTMAVPNPQQAPWMPAPGPTNQPVRVFLGYGGQSSIFQIPGGPAGSSRVQGSVIVEIGTGGFYQQQPTVLYYQAQ